MAPPVFCQMTGLRPAGCRIRRILALRQLPNLLILATFARLTAGRLGWTIVGTVRGNSGRQFAVEQVMKSAWINRERWAFIAAFLALAGLIHSGHSGIRSDMNEAHESIRADMNAAHESIRADMNAAHESIRFDMNAAHEDIRIDLRQIREQLNNVDRRTARIEGHLFGIEIQEEP